MNLTKLKIIGDIFVFDPTKKDDDELNNKTIIYFNQRIYNFDRI